MKLESEKILSLEEKSNISYPIKKIGKSYLIPKKVSLELTYKCNFSCRYCYQDSDPSRKEYLKEPIALLSYLKKIGVYSIELTGGEPLLHPNIMQVIEYIVKNFNSYSLITNGTLLNDKMLTLLSQIKGQVQICVDSSNEDGLIQIAGTKGVFNRVLNGIKKCVAYGIPVRVGMVLDNAENIADIENVLILAKNLGAYAFVVNPTINIGRGGNLNSFTEVELEEFTIKHNELLLKYPNFYGSETVSQDLLDNSINCGAGSKMVTVSPDERIKLCSMQNIEWLNLGKIYDVKTDLLQKKIKTTLELPTPTKEICNGCTHTYYCMKCFVRPLNLIKNKTISEQNCKWFTKYSNELKTLGY